MRDARAKKLLTDSCLDLTQRLRGDPAYMNGEVSCFHAVVAPADGTYCQCVGHSHGRDRLRHVARANRSTANHLGLLGALIFNLERRVRPMSALGQKQTFEPGSEMSALPPKADMRPGAQNVR